MPSPSNPPTLTPQQQLHTAVMEGASAQEVKAAIDKGADIHFEQDILLDAALSMGHPHIFFFFVNNYHFNLKNNWRCLRDAASSGNKEVLDYLIDKRGLDVNMHGGIALHSACLSDQAETFAYLLTKGATLKPFEYVGYAWSQCSFDVLDFLLQLPEQKDFFFSDLTVDCYLTPSQIEEKLEDYTPQLFETLSKLRAFNEGGFHKVKDKILASHLGDNVLLTTFLEKVELEHSVEAQCLNGQSKNVYKI